MMRKVVAGCVVVFAGFACADKIVLNGTTYTDVRVRQSETRYYVELPDGKTLSVPKADVKPDDVTIDKRPPQKKPSIQPAPLPSAPSTSSPAPDFGHEKRPPLKSLFLKGEPTEPAKPLPAAPQASHLAPGFNVKTVDEEPLRFSDCRGKLVLLDFWATWCGPCKAETKFLKATFDAFGRDTRFVMIGLSLDTSAGAPRAYAKEQGCSWIQGFLGEWSKDAVTKSYGVTGIPAIFLIGPDGAILADGLRGTAIQQAVAKALQTMEPSASLSDRTESSPGMAKPETAVNAAGGRSCMEFTIRNSGGLPEIPEYACTSFTQHIVEKTPTSIRIRTEALAANPVMRQRYPVENVPNDVAIYLKPTPHIQSNQPAIEKAARVILDKARTQRAHELVRAVLAYVSEHMQYGLSNEVPDAVLCQNRCVGNCIGYTHLSAALLRNLGIPCRTVRMYVVQSSGHLNRHSIVEVYYPEDAAWVLYEPQCGGIPPSPQLVYAYHDADWNRDGQRVVASLSKDPKTAAEIITACQTSNGFVP